MTEETIVQNENLFEEENNLQSQSEPQVDPEIKRDLLCEAADEIKAREITVLDVQGLTTLADFFVMCSGTSTTHIQSIAQGVRDRLRERASLRAKPEGDSASCWIILDYGDVILHIFDEETREFYDLERLWADAKVTPYVSPENGTKQQDESDSDDRFRQSTVRQEI
jgi:ribosome-associated protein